LGGGWLALRLGRLGCVLAEGAWSLLARGGAVLPCLLWAEALRREGGSIDEAKDEAAVNGPYAPPIHLWRNPVH
jgi:hypothetical protein